MDIVQRQVEPGALTALLNDGVPTVLARVLAARGLVDAANVHAGLAELLPRSALLHCDAMGEVLARAIVQNKRILVVADYDADGATACSVAVRALRAYGANAGYLIPNRLEHGYGLTPEIARLAAAQLPKPDIIVTVDNGIASHAGVEEANRLGIEVLVTDHHLPADTLPAARLIVNPNQPDCPFTSKALAGCGVMWYVTWAMQEAFEQLGLEPLEPGFTVNDLLPLVALGTVADVVSLDDNNRILVREGLARIRCGASLAGIDALAQVAQRNPRQLSTGDIAFGLGPRVNAAGRLQSMDAGVECLTTDDPERARALAQSLHDINQQRRDIEGTMVAEAVNALLEDVRPERFTVVVHDSNWHQGVIGIVAGRLKERVYRPTFVLVDDNSGGYKGSGRSIPGFHLRDALDILDKRHPEILAKFGGHAMAAGVTLNPGQLQAFSEAFEQVASELLTPAILRQQLETDGPLSIDEMSMDTVEYLRPLVWGQGFPEPTFSDVFTVVGARRLGAERNHLRMTLEKDGRQFVAIRFRHEDPADPPAQVRAVFKLDTNTFRGQTSLQLLVDHLQPA